MGSTYSTFCIPKSTFKNSCLLAPACDICYLTLIWLPSTGYIRPELMSRAGPAHAGGSWPLAVIYPLFVL
jgi:hypothetical protein